jgi:hypothetical protein
MNVDAVDDDEWRRLWVRAFEGATCEEAIDYWYGAM